MENGRSNDVLMNDRPILDSTENQEPFDSLLGFLEVPASNAAKSATQPATASRGTGSKLEDAIDPQLEAIDRPKPAKFDKLPYASSQTGLVYDVRMRFHVEAVPEDTDIHPEDPRRIHAIFQAFVQAGLAWHKGAEGPSNYYMGRIDAREVSKEEVCLVHTERHWDWIQSLRDKSVQELLTEMQHPDQKMMDSVYLSPNTPFCAALSAGGAIEACRAVMLGKVKNAFAVIRPPGHHAEREDVKGFCFFDNVSIATKVCQREFGEKCRKVLILDWDVHHGNGIQQANYDDPNVLYISLHVHKDGNFYPEKSYRDNRERYGDHLHCGAGVAQGTNVNIPWRTHGMGDADYIYAFQQVVMPIGTEFQPDLVIVAAGFDAAEGDMLGGCHVSPAGYAHMIHMLMSLADGKVVVCLEGGYNLESIARSACAVGRTLMGEPPDRLEDTSPTRTGVDDIKLVLRQQSKFWASLYPKDVSARLAGPLHGERMHDVVRKWQATTLWEKHEMSPLFVHHETLSPSFENQVLATPDYMEAKPLLVILHDPPEVLASPDPRTGQIDLHNTWLTDIVKTYVDWAVKQDFAVLDVNLPKHITAEEDDLQEHEKADSIEHRTREATQVLTYLWDNYIEVNDATHVFLMGTNTGHGAIINFIKANEERAEDRITKAISFIEDVPLQVCRSATNENLAKWYYSASLVFVAGQHNFWASDYARKPKKRFGRMFKSGDENISDMLTDHKDTVTDALLSETAAWRMQKPARRITSAAAHDESPIAPETDATRKLPIGSFSLPSDSVGSPWPSLAATAVPANGRLVTSSPKAPPIGNFALPPRNGSPSSPRR